MKYICRMKVSTFFMRRREIETAKFVLLAGKLKKLLVGHII